MLPLYVSFYFLAFQTLEVPNNWYTNDIHAIISARSLAENASINPKQSRKLKFFSAKSWNWVQKVEIKLIDNARWVKGLPVE